MSDEQGLTIQEVKNLAQEMLGPVHMNDRVFRTGVILLSILQVGATPERLAEFTGYSLKRGIIQNVIARMESAGIKKDNAFRVDWLKEETGDQEKTVAFVLDVMTIDGAFTRTEKDGELYYQMTERSIAEVEEMKPNEA